MACEPNRARLLCMLSLTFGFFVVEVVVSRVTSSLAMLSDSFHMLSDVIALVVALVAVRFAEKTRATNKNTFGWIRAEVMGALVNAVFLTALCFTIVLEAIERFTEPHVIKDPIIVAAVGAAGLVVNLLGLWLFHGHGGHGHSHGSKSKRSKSQNSSNGSSGEETNNLVGNHNSPGEANSERGRSEISCKDSTELQMNGKTHYEELDEDHGSSSQLNMRGVFLHVLGDALGSVIVVFTSVIFKLVWERCRDTGPICESLCFDSNITGHNKTLGELNTSHCWVLYLDPTLCIIMVTILLYTTYPLLKESALILLQTVPKQVNMQRLNEQLLGLDGVLAIHDLHIWQLAGSRIIATAHIKCRDPTSYMDVAKRIKDFFHNEGIHATTIQPEFVTFNSESRDSLCELSCQTQCAPKLCCGTSDKQSSDKKSNSQASDGGSSAGSSAVLEVVSETTEQASVQVYPRTKPEVAMTREVESSL